MRIRTAAVALTVATTLAGLVSVASTQTAAPVPAAAAVDAVPESTQEEKARAMTILGLLPDDQLLTLNDKDFVIAMWRRSTGAEVRASAELAFSGAEGECTQFIKFGLREARTRDQANEIRDAEIARAARELRQKAAAAIGVEAEPEQLIKSDKDFIYLLTQRAPGRRVKDAALVAFGQSEVEQREFLQTGIVTAHARDQQDAIDANEQADAAEKARLAARNARGRAASAIAVVASDELMDKSDDNFVRAICDRVICDRAPCDANKPGAEVAAATLAALRSSQPADWKTYIDTGIFDASRRDIANALRKKAEENKRIAQDILTKAEASKVHPNLVTMARRALAGNDAGIDRFIRLGQYEALTQSLRSLSEFALDYYLDDASGVGVVTRRDPAGLPGSQAMMTWKVLPGLADPKCLTLESPTKPGYYFAFIPRTPSAFSIAPSDGTDAFRSKATFCPAWVTGGVGLRLHVQPLLSIQVSPGKLQIGTGTPTPFAIDPPSPNAVSAIMLRWNNDDPVRALAGNPTGDEAVAGTVRYRQFERGRMFWTAKTGAQLVQEPILRAYLTLSGPTSSIYGPPTTDDLTTPDGGKFNVFTGGGSIYYHPSTGGAFAVYGAIKTHWDSLGGLNSFLKYPTSSEFAIPGGRRNTFQGGRIDFITATGEVHAYAN